MTADGAIILDRVSVKFSAEIVAVSDVSLSIRTGEFVSIVGPSGCGKTTLLNFAAGLLPRASARAASRWAASRRLKAIGRSPTCWRATRWRRGAPPSRTPNSAARSAAYRPPSGVPAHSTCSKRSGSKGFENAYPKQLSQGMRQRVALARTFALASPILLMDEPFGALDAQTKLQLEEVLLSLWQRDGRTVLFITHDLSEAVTMSDRVIVMSARPGRIVADVPISLPRPRSVRALQKDPAFHELYAHVWSKLEEGLGL